MTANNLESSQSQTPIFRTQPRVKHRQHTIKWAGCDWLNSSNVTCLQEHTPASSAGHEQACDEAEYLGRRLSDNCSAAVPGRKYHQHPHFLLLPHYQNILTMAPHVYHPTDLDPERLPAPERPAFSTNPPRILIIGAGSRGNAYAKATGRSSNGIVVAVAEPIAYKRKQMGERYIWGKGQPSDGQAFEDWRAFLTWETARRERAAKGEDVPEGVDAVFICVLDEMHKDVIVGLAPLDLHVMCEKPLATTLEDCVAIYKSLLPQSPETTPSKIFSIGHVLRYSPHNMLLRKLLVEDKVIGEVMSINHTEPVGWWHFTHSYVRYTSFRWISRHS